MTRTAFEENDAAPVLPAAGISVEGSLPREGATAEVPRGRRKLVHVRELDGVRGIAAIAVLFHHVCFTSTTAAGWGTGVALVRELSAYGYVGVDLFFVLSGFLISSLLIEDRASPRYYHDFYWKRALRILPLYVVCLLGALAFGLVTKGYLVMALLFVANFATVFHIASEGPFWTLAIEEQFYLVWPTVVRRRTIEDVSKWAVGIGLSSVVLRFVAAASGHHNYFLTMLHCDGLAMGAWLACRFERWGRLGFQTARERTAWLLAIVAALLFMAVPPYLWPGERLVALVSAFRQSGITLLMGAVIAFLLVHRGKRFVGVFRWKVLTFFGLISYAMYMMHLYVLHLYDHYAPVLAGGDVAGFGRRLLIVFCATVVLSLVSRYVLELPAASLRRFVLHKPVK